MGKKGSQGPLEVTCMFSGEEELEMLLMRAFSLYISCETAKKQINAV